MKRFIFIVILSLGMSAYVNSVLAQDDPTPSPPVDTLSPEVEQRINELENQVNALELEREVILRAGEAQREQSQLNTDFLTQIFTTFVNIFVGLAAVVAVFQGVQIWQRRGEHGVQVANTEGATKVLEAAGKLLEHRYMEVEDTKKAMEAKLDDLEKLGESIKSGIENELQDIEDTAIHLAETPRHDFKNIIGALDDFARDFDSFERRYPEVKIKESEASGQPEGEKGEASEKPEVKEIKFSGRAQYVRGIAAHFRNELQELQTYLGKVPKWKSEAIEHRANSYEKRVANAYYYLGLQYSNLGGEDEIRSAIGYLEKAREQDPQTDFLTQLVMAEVYVNNREYGKAKKDFLQKVESGLKEIKRTEGGLELHQRRFLSRTYLIRANIALIDNDLKTAREYAKQADAPELGNYYYAPLTLAQILKKQGETDEAKVLFEKAYSQLQDSGHLHSVTEVRIRILVLMVAALCGKHGEVVNGTRINDYLNDAKKLVGDLPRIDNLVCTVFSPISKRNVDGSTIIDHINDIRAGKWLL